MNNAEKLHTFILHYPTAPTPFWELVRLAQELDANVELKPYDFNMMEFLFTDGSGTAFDYREL